MTASRADQRPDAVTGNGVEGNAVLTGNVGALLVVLLFVEVAGAVAGAALLPSASAWSGSRVANFQHEDH